MTVETRCEPRLWRALADTTQLELALLNLVINARDAMPAGGTITIAAANAAVAQPSDAAGLRPGDYVRITVMDQGEGMSKEVLEHAFEPYFTTKKMGEGTGMGLSMVQGMAVQLGGAVIISSRLGYGTSVSIFLPRAEADAPVDEGQAADLPERVAQECEHAGFVFDDQYAPGPFAGRSSLGVHERQEIREALACLRLVMARSPRSKTTGWPSPSTSPE